MKKIIILLIILVSACQNTQQKKPEIGTIEEIANLDINPGNVTISEQNRIFASIHQFRDAPYRLIEVTGKESYKPFPDENVSKTLTSPLGVEVDTKNRLWVIDNGNAGKKSAPPKIIAFDIDSKKEVFRHEFSKEVAPIGSFPQDMAIDAERGFAYIADIGLAAKPGIIILDINKNSSYKISGHKSFEAEDVDMKVEGKILTVKDKNKRVPARVGINPITLSANGDWLFYGAMNGTSWWVLPTDSLREKAGLSKIFSQVERVGQKLVSDGAATDNLDNHYFTALNENAIVKLTNDGKLTTLIRDSRLIWPDSISFGKNGWIYVAVNQLNRTAFFNEKEAGKPPYKIFRIYVGEEGVVGR